MSTIDVAGQSALPRRSMAAVVLRPFKNLVLGTLLCLTPLTAIVVLGWLAERARAAALRRGASDPGAVEAPAWLLDPAAENLPGRWFGGLAANTARGLGVLAGLVPATLPFGALWALSWWAGWENSFNKGYEQAGAGPALGLLGIAIALPILWYLPMGLAHQAVEQRWRAFYDIGAVRRLIGFAGWPYLALIATGVVLALPLFLLQALPVFIPVFVPDFGDLPPERVQDIAEAIQLGTAAWIFLSLCALRVLAGRLYARAARRWLASGEARARALALAGDIVLPPPGAVHVRKPGRIATFVRFTVGGALLFGLVAQIYVGQFLNHDWVGWLTHPHILLPWAH